MKAILILFNKKGMTLIECLVAFVLTTIAVVSLMTMQSLAWKGSGSSDYLGRAAEILQRELEFREGNMLWGTPGLVALTTCADKSGNTVTCGTSSAVFTITYNTPTSTATLRSDGVTVTTYLINVQVTWPGSVNGITSSMKVSR